MDYDGVANIPISSGLAQGPSTDACILTLKGRYTAYNLTPVCVCVCVLTSAGEIGSGCSQRLAEGVWKKTLGNVKTFHSSGKKERPMDLHAALKKVADYLMKFQNDDLAQPGKIRQANPETLAFLGELPDTSALVAIGVVVGGHMCLWRSLLPS